MARGGARGPAPQVASQPVSRILSRAIISLGRPSPSASSDQPGTSAGRVIRSLFGLAAGGVCRAGRLPGRWCALAAPFHPCPRRAFARPGRFAFLWHYPWGRPRRALPGTLPCAVRTFLRRRVAALAPAIAWPARLRVPHSTGSDRPVQAGRRGILDRHGTPGSRRAADACDRLRLGGRPRFGGAPALCHAARCTAHRRPRRHAAGAERPLRQRRRHHDHHPVQR